MSDFRRLIGGSVAGLAIAITACGGNLEHTVKASYLREVSRQGQHWIFDAQNEIVVALDKLDHAKETLADTRRRLTHAEKSVAKAKKKRNSFGVEVAKAWLSYLELLEDWAQENIKLQHLGVKLARASVELAKAQLINREELLGGKDFAVEDFQDQCDKIRDRLLRREKKVHAIRTEARKQEKDWWRLRARFVAKTGDFDSGLWID